MVLVFTGVIGTVVSVGVLVFTGSSGLSTGTFINRNASPITREKTGAETVPHNIRPF